MPVLQPPRRTLRLAALSVVPFIGLASVASAAALDSRSHGNTPTTASGSFIAASASVASPTADDRQLTLDSAIRGSGYARPFRSTSWWNTPLGRAPRDSHNRAYIRDSQNRAHTQNYLKLVLGDWGLPTYQADKSDPRFRINPGNGPTITVHIPVHARQMPTSDGELRVVDPSTNQAVGLSGAHYNSSTHNWTASGLSRYYLSSNGIEESFKGGRKGNQGHRGIPSPMQGVTKHEVLRGAIRHRLEVYWWETASRTPQGREAYFPMPKAESGKNGKVPEGIVMRIKPSVNLKAKHLSRGAYVVARALQRYGAVIGDNSGSGNNLKLQANADWSRVLNKNSLRSIHWSDYMFVRGGYRP